MVKHAFLAAALVAGGLGLGASAEAQTIYIPAGPDARNAAARELLDRSMNVRPDTGAAAAGNLNCQPPAIPAPGWGALPASRQPC